MRLQEFEDHMDRGAYVTRGDSRVFRLSRRNDEHHDPDNPILMGGHIGDGYSGEAMTPSMLDWADITAEDWNVFDGRGMGEGPPHD